MLPKWLLISIILTTCYLLSLAKASPFTYNDNDDGTVVETDAGFIRGHILKSENGIDYWAFQEIPYAAPPVGENRFMPPKPVQPWDGILNTTKTSIQCYQDSMFPGGEISEDCLFLNVYSPMKPGSNDTLPVMVWIHGGGFRGAACGFSGCNPHYFMDHGIIVVTLEYRLGPFGFFGTDDGVIPFNVGIKDQYAAIQWVNRNIEKFGGNNSRVVISGQSAGSISVSEHLLGEWEDDVELFQGAIMESGTAVHVISSDYVLVRNATEVAFELAKAIDENYTPTTTTDVLEFLQKADAKDIQKKGYAILDYINPEVKGTFQRYLDGDYKKIPVLVGFNSEEAIMLGSYLNETLRAEVDANVSLLISMGVNMSPENRSIAGALYKDIYTNGSSFVDNPGAFVRHESDTHMFATATCKQVELASAYSPYYFFKFSYYGKWGSNVGHDIPEGAEKVGHGDEIAYLWGNPGNSDISKAAEADQITSKRMVKMWTNFVKYLNPTPEEDSLLGNITWLPSEPNTLRYLNIDETLQMEENPRKCKERSAILEKYMEPPYNFFE